MEEELLSLLLLITVLACLVFVSWIDGNIVPLFASDDVDGLIFKFVFVLVSEFVPIEEVTLWVISCWSAETFELALDCWDAEFTDTSPIFWLKWFLLFSEKVSPGLSFIALLFIFEE